jgi:hypothetical protein
MTFDPKNPKPGIYENIDHHTYHRVLTDVVSNSYLGKLAQCPAKAKILDEETPSLLFGRALHAYVLDREQWAREFATVPDMPVYKINKNKTEYREAFASFQADNLGKQIVSLDDYNTIQNIYAAIMSNPAVGQYLTGGTKEVTVIWQDKDIILPSGDCLEGTQLWCKTRPDAIPVGDHGVVLDLKTTRNAGEHPFQTTIVTYGYDRQGAMALHGLSQVTGKVHDLFGLIAVEPLPPYRTEIYVLDDQFLKHGFSEYRRLLRLEKACREQNAWPNYTIRNILDVRQVQPQTMLMPGYLSAEGRPWENSPPEE